MWLTVFIAVYRYLAICKAYGNVYSHVMLHGQKYVKLIVILIILYNVPLFIEHYLETYDKDGQVYISFKTIGLFSDQFYDVYYNYVGAALVVCLPLIILQKYIGEKSPGSLSPLLRLVGRHVHDACSVRPRRTLPL